MDIPIIDFNNCGLHLENDGILVESDLEAVGTKLYKAFAASGFAYIENHGMPNAILDEIYRLSDIFFDQPHQYKMKFCSKGFAPNLCYDPMGGVTSNPERPSDFNEGFRLPAWTADNEWPDIDNMKTNVVEFQRLCKILTFRVFKALGRGMSLKDADLFCKSHNLIGHEGNRTGIRLLRYPAITEEVSLKENQTRIGEHTDFATLTLLFNDGIGGLQMKTSKGNFEDVRYIPNTILLITGDMIEFWSGGRLKSTLHRVIVPNDKEERSKIRRTVAYFASVDDEVELRELEFKDSPPKNIERKVMTSLEYFNKRFGDLFYQ
ncbi:uncharacterized protein LOC120326349 [Styela clava]